MPRSTRLIALGLLALSAGCESLRGGRGGDSVAATGGAVAPKSAEQLVNYLNEQSAAVSSLRYLRVSIDASAPGQSVSLGQSELACEKPHNFALRGGKIVASDLLVVGSNAERFWVYQRAPERSYIYCSRADLPAEAAKLPVPIDPDWAMQALGLYTYPLGLDYQVETLQSEREYHLSYHQQAAGGKPVRVTVVFAADLQADYSPQVRRLVIEDDATHKIVATAQIKAVSRVQGGPRGGVPMTVELAWPLQGAKVALDLGEPEVNPHFDAKARDYYFAMRDLGVTPVNLTQMRLSGSVRAQAPESPRSSQPGARHVAERRRWGR